jgi:hemerythrin-like domain-containing protein
MKTRERPTESFRTEHMNLKRHLEHIRVMAGELPEQGEPEQREVMARIVRFFEHHITPHAQWEEERLYPLGDQLAGGSQPFTASLRYEHRLVDRGVAELRRELGRGDAAAFARRADQLIGLVGAHFEVEEEVLLPILDQAMTVEEFRAAIGEQAIH